VPLLKSTNYCVETLEQFKNKLDVTNYDIVKNHHGRYRLRSHTNGSISMRGLNSKGKLIDGDVEVNHVE
jgi:hypothetical protein